MVKLRRSAGSLLLVLVLFGTAFGAQRLLGQAWQSLDKYQSPFLRQLPAGQGSTPLTDAVVLVVISGLREDASYRMPALEYLRSRGATVSVKSVLPSLALSSRATILTGADPEIHEVVMNSFAGPLRSDHLFESARRSGLTTGLVATKNWQALLGSTAEDGRFLDPRTPGLESQVVEQAASLLQDPPSILILNLAAPAVVGGRFGANSDQYLQSISETDSRLAMILDLIDLENVTVMVTSDYGLTNIGGHGGSEVEVTRLPLVMAGQGIRPGTTLAIAQEDIAPTVAALLGIAIPSNSTGQPTWAALDVPDEVLKEKLALAASQLAVAKTDALAALGAPPPEDPPYDLNPATLSQWLQDIRMREDKARLKLQEAQRQKRLPLVGWSLGGGLLLLLLLVRALRGPLLVRAIGAYLITYYLIFIIHFIIRGNRYSLSALVEPGSISAFFLARAWESGLAMALGSLVIGWCFARRGPWRPRQVVLASLAVALSVVVVIGLQVLAPIFLHGLETPPDVAANPWRIKYYVDLLQVLTIGYLAPVWPLAALVGAKLGSLGKAGHGPVLETRKVARRSRPARARR